MMAAFPFSASALMTAVEEFTRAPDGTALWGNLHRQLQPFGITEMIYGLEALPDPAQDIAPLYNSLSPDWLEAKLSLDLFACDDYVSAARQQTAPMLWSDTSRIAAMSPAARRSYALDVEYGILTGASVPMRFAGGLGASSIGLHASGLSMPDFDRLWLEQSGSIIAIVNAFDTALRRDHLQPLFPLHNEDRDCLLWLAAGLKQKQIAHRLRLSEAQVEKRMMRARRTLNADTSTRAVVNAMILGLITP